jgi:hypothetical protein
MFKSEKNCFLKMILIEFVRSGGKNQGLCKLDHSILLVPFQFLSLSRYYGLKILIQFRGTKMLPGDTKMYHFL